MTPESLAEDLLAQLAESPPTFADEAQLQRVLLGLLQRATPNEVEREVRLSKSDRLDFFVRVGDSEPRRGIAVEVKVQGSLSDLTRQLFRYAEHEQVTGLLVITTVQRHRQLPPTIDGKPLSLICLGDFLLAG